MKIGLLAVVTLMLAPLAHAESGCDLIGKLLSGADSGFANIRGEKFDDGWFDTDVWLSGAEECTIMLEGSSEYSCVWPEKQISAADARTSNLETVARLCLPDWDRNSLSGGNSTNNLKINRGTSYRKGPISIELYHETYTDGSETLVWFKVFGPKVVRNTAG